jgi:hypothetical protein
MKNLLRWALPWLAAACMHNPTAVYAQTKAPMLLIREITPPPPYAQWYAAMERCAGLKGAFVAVRWFVTPTPWVDGQHGNDSTYGMTYRHHIVLNLPEALDSTLVSHEALHDILSYHPQMWIDAGPHPAPWFAPDGCAEEFHVVKAKVAP